MLAPEKLHSRRLTVSFALTLIIPRSPAGNEGQPGAIPSVTRAPGTGIVNSVAQVAVLIAGNVNDADPVSAVAPIPTPPDPLTRHLPLCGVANRTVTL